MDQKQSLNVGADFFSGFTAAFIQLVSLIIVVYLLLVLINFLRDKFINKETDTKKEEIGDLLIILNKLFFGGGIGFITANIFQSILSHTPAPNMNPIMNFRGEWDYLVFGIILISVGIGFKQANKTLAANKIQE